MRRESDAERRADGAAAPCERVREALVDALLARREGPEREAAHLADCAACREEARVLGALRSALDAEPPPRLDPALLARVRRRAAGELRERRAARGFALEAVRAAAAALVVAVPVTVIHAELVFAGLRWLLEGRLPGVLLRALEALYLGSSLLAVGLLLASVPLLLAFRGGGGMARPAEGGAG